MAQTVQGLVLRIPNGAPLPPQQGDQNLTILANFANALAAAVAASLNPDGTLANGAINSLAQFSSIQLFADNFIASLSLPVSTNLLLNSYIVANPNITFPGPGYVAGMRIQFKANFANTLPCTINYNGLGVASIVKSVNQPLEANDIIANSIVEIIYDGANFQLVSMSASPASTTALGPVLLAENSDLAVNNGPNNAVSVGALFSTKFVSSAVPLPVATGQVATIVHPFVTTPQYVRWVLVNQVADVGYSPNDELDVYSFQQSYIDAEPAFAGGANATNVFLSVFITVGGLAVANKTTGIQTGIVLANWKAKCYASLY